MSGGENELPWYAAGLHFECLQCGRCCSGPAGGYIWVSRPEIRLIANHLNMSVKELKNKFLRRVVFRMTVIEDAHTRDCVFLRESGQLTAPSKVEGGKGCMIYPVRPRQCRSWPFWPNNLAGPDSWNSTARKCPGINRGASYDPEQIQAIKSNPKWWRPVLRPVRRSESEVGSSSAKDGNDKA